MKLAINGKGKSELLVRSLLAKGCIEVQGNAHARKFRPADYDKHGIYYFVGKNGGWRKGPNWQQSKSLNYWNECLVDVMIRRHALTDSSDFLMEAEKPTAMVKADMEARTRWAV